MAEIAKKSNAELLALIKKHEDYVPAVKASAKSTEDFATTLNAELKTLSEAITKEEATTAVIIL